jgi:hypothetical protein
MNENTAGVLILFIFWGWIPILAIGKSIVWIIGACRNK